MTEKSNNEKAVSEKTTGDKQNIKKQRIKTYFLEAAKGIIVDEGVEYVSVRKVADIAGYSYATIYNYFKDLNELLWEVKGLMINDLIEYMQTKISQPSNDAEGIKKIFRTYVEYYFLNPNVFKFFYLYRQSKPVKVAEDAIKEPDYTLMWGETFKGFVREGKLKEKDIEVIAKIFIYAMHGMLTLSFSNNGEMTEENVYKDLDKIVDYLL